MKVAKFGGSSVANATQIKKVADIITADSERKFAVVSAPGKRFKGDSKITDLLIQYGEAFVKQANTKENYQAIIDRFQEITTELGLEDTAVLEDIKNTIDRTFEGNLNNIHLDAVKAIGEDSSAKILSAYLNKIGVEANYINPKDAGIIVSDEPGNAQILPESYEKIYNLRKRNGVSVIPGFFGYTTDEKLTTFSRGGSDITGAIVAAGVQASLYENFTDVDSVYTVNPTIVDNPKEITVMTYKEMRELSYAGFSVFHDEALIPAIKAKIPVCIKNTNNPDGNGTMIVSEREIHSIEDCVVGIASDTGFSSLYVSKFLMNREIGFARKLFNIFEDEGISFEHTPSGIDDMSVIIREDKITAEKEETIMKRIKEELEVDTVSIQHDIAVVMVVGEGLEKMIGVASKAVGAFAEANVNIEMINQGSSEVSIMFGILADDMNASIKSLYNAFFG